jgi:hypothetical protein
MSEPFFEPGRRSNCLFSPDLFCDVFRHASPTGVFEFLCDLQPQMVGVILPASEGAAGERWDQIYRRIAAVWEERTLGFRCVRIDAEGWSQPRPCSACEIARRAQVVVIDVTRGDERAGSFKEMAHRSERTLAPLRELPGGRVPRKRIILISCGPVALPPHERRTFHFIDYANAAGEPDLDLLGKRLQAAIAEMELFATGEFFSFDEKDFTGAGGRAPARFDVRDIVILGPPVPQKLQAAVQPPAESPRAALTAAGRLARAGSHAAALRALQRIGTTAADGERPRLRALAADCAAHLTTREIAQAYFQPEGMAAGARLALSEWQPGSPFESALLTVGDPGLKKLLGAATLPIYAGERITTKAAQELQVELAARPDGCRTALVVAAESEEAAGRLLAESRDDTMRLIEVRRRDLEAAEIERPRPVDYLAGRLDGRYGRGGDLFLQDANCVACGPHAFFGHAELLAALGGRLQSGEIFAIFGLPRAGKSSLLAELRRRSAADGCLAVLVDLQQFRSSRLGDLYHFIGRAVRRELEERHSAAWQALNMGGRALFSPAAAVEDGWRGTLAEDLGALASALRDHPELRLPGLVLLFDDVDRILPDPVRGPAGSGGLDGIHDLLEELRLLAEHEVGVGMAGFGAGLRQALTAVGSPLAGRILLQPLGSLSAAECGQMVRAIGGEMYRYFPDATLREVLRASGCDPCLTRYLCSTVLEAEGAAPGLVRPAQGLVRPEVVGFGIQYFLRSPGLCAKLGRSFHRFARVWPDEAGLLHHVAVSRSVEDTIDSAGLEGDGRLAAALPESLQNLCEHGLLERVETDRYRISIGLLHHWLRQESGI